MLQDQNSSIDEKVLEFFEIQGKSNDDLKALDSVMPATDLLNLAIESTNESINTLMCTQLICKSIKGSNYDALKGASFLSMNIYFTITRLKSPISLMSKHTRRIIDTGDYLELSYYQKMARYLIKHLKKSGLPNIYERISNDMFESVEQDYRGFKYKISPLGRTLERNLTELLEKGQRHFHDVSFFDVSMRMTSHDLEARSLGLKLVSDMKKTEEHFKTKKIIYNNFVPLKGIFDVCVWPYIELESKAQELLTKMDETRKQFKGELSKLRAEKVANPKTSSESSSSSSTNTDRQALTEEPEPSQHEGQSSDDDESGVYGELHRMAIAANAASSSASASKSIASESSSSSSSSEVPFSPGLDVWKDLKGGKKQVKFDDMIKAFKHFLNADVDSSQTTEITFRGPNDMLTTIYCHTPHGSQLTKAWPAWRYSMIAGLMESGIKFAE
ncbi:hypothetical protein [Candidatus Finniella inopinata]|uniref:Uncharacterized protein n=1 Tax=Candidatus Finniella inopinata TaxID=1696036 RepID=A0A4Q7DHM0_9PROT|nr:hypothetical protein [Candidatus Finniella inopinata]RZI45840.1 hypothetical protein EQU50_05240 [Candidatus Finniella inopinata]